MEHLTEIFVFAWLRPKKTNSSFNCSSLGPDEMEILLQFMYGAIVDLPPGANAGYCI